jgi:uncharacterized protein (DUF1697 family)
MTSRARRKRYVALVRGINVGTHKRVSMADLRAVFEAVGAENVVTHLQSGNVVFESPESARKLAPSIERELERSVGLQVSVLLRTPADLAKLERSNPYGREQDGKKVHVAFLDASPTASRARTLDKERVAPDEFRVAGRHVFLHYPRGYARSKLTNDYLERQLSVRSTMRNWTTVKALAELAGAKRGSR